MQYSIDLTCQSFPGPGEDHIYTFNPMKEFIDNEESHVHAAFSNFKKDHKKKYDTAKEHFHRLELFRQNMR